MRFKTIIIVSLFAVAVAGCGGSFDRNIESRVTISQGVYGQTVSYDDAAPVSHDYLTGNLKVFTAPRNDSPAVAETTSDDHGFYEVELAPGDYEICINGKFPINPSGGVVASNPIGATALVRVAEAAMQVRRTAGRHQVPKEVRKALASGFGGTLWTVLMLLSKDKPELGN